MASKKFSDLTPGQQAVLVVLGPAIIAAFVLYEFVLPLRPRAAHLHAQLETLRAQNERARSLEARHTDFLNRLSAAEAELQQLRQIVPDQASDDEIVRMVYGVAEASSVHVRSLMAETPQTQPYFVSLPFRLHADGTYYNMLDFFMRMASTPRIVNIADLSLGAPQAGGGAGSYKVGAQETVSADCLLTTYYNNPQGAGPKTTKTKRK